MRNPPGPPGVVTIEGGVARGRVCAPPSKSYTHRALVAGFLTGGPYAIHNALRSEDTLASRDAVRALAPTCGRAAGPRAFGSCARGSPVAGGPSASAPGSRAPPCVFSPRWPPCVRVR